MITGHRVIVRDAMGRLLWKVAISEPIAGKDLAVVWVRWPDRPDGEGVPWPFEDVWTEDGQTATLRPPHHSRRPSWRRAHASNVRTGSHRMMYVRALAVFLACTTLSFAAVTTLDHLLRTC